MTEITTTSSFVINSTPRLVQGDVRDTAQRVGVIKEIPSGGDLGVGLTDRIYLIGHADGLALNDPYQIINVQDMINILGADTESPLLRGFFDVYNEGARDIWIVAAAPMSEYIIDQSDRNVSYEHLNDQTFYETYYDRLTTTYSILRDFSEPEIITALEAPLYYTGSVDFLTQLADHCADSVSNTGKIRLGFIGTKMENQATSDIDAILADSRISTLSNGSNGRYITIVGGEISVSHPQMEIAYSTSVSTSAAGMLSACRVDRGLMHKKSRTAISQSALELTPSQLSNLAINKVNWIGRTKLGTRGIPYQIHVKTDNTVTSGNNSWSVSHIRVMSKVVNSIHAMGNRYIGSLGYPQFKQDVASYLNYLMQDNMIKDYDLSIYREVENPETAIVDVSLKIFGTLREIFLSVAVGNKTTVS
jgi:hypothetical protein